jgi:hypothetical protein
MVKKLPNTKSLPLKALSLSPPASSALCLYLVSFNST